MSALPADAGPLKLAHNHAANADDHLANGMLVLAAEEHQKAADAFLACIQSSNDKAAKRTLNMLYEDHLKANKELQRRIEKIREDGGDPSSPQRPVMVKQQNTESARRPMSPYGAVAGTNGSPTNGASAGVSQGRKMVDSDTVEESFMELGLRSQNDPGDAFNRFWRKLDDVLDSIEKPLAFATASIDAAGPTTPAKKTKRLGREGSSSDTDFEDPMAGAAARAKMPTPQRRAAAAAALQKSRTGASAGAPVPMTFPPPKLKEHVLDLKDELDEVLADDSDDLSESFFLIPSSAESSSNAGAIQLRKENVMLKAELEATQKRLAASERVIQKRREQDAQLRDSIVMAKKEYSQAQRAMASSTLAQRGHQQPITGQLPVDLGSLNVNVPPPIPPSVAALNPGPSGRDREAQLLRRVRELEEETRVLRVENEKQKAMITRFRERWEKLKESAKRKKQAKAASAAVGERIDEEPEAEERAEEMEKGEQEATAMATEDLLA